MFAGTRGSKPSSSTGIPNSLSLPSYVFTMLEWASLIFLSSAWISLIASFFKFSTSSRVLLMTPRVLGSILAAASNWFIWASFVSRLSYIVSSFFSRTKFLRPVFWWISYTVWWNSSKSSFFSLCKY